MFSNGQGTHLRCCSPWNLGFALLSEVRWARQLSRDVTLLWILDFDYILYTLINGMKVSWNKLFKTIPYFTQMEKAPLNDGFFPKRACLGGPP